MSLPVIEPTASARRHPELLAIFRAAENRHLAEEDLREYERVLPAFAARAKAAREVALIETEVVQQVVDEIFIYYPFEKRHAYARVKTIRDITSVSAYATLSMLMNDPQWYRDKLLLWLRTILQAFDFPDREVQKKKTLFASASSAIPANVAPNQRAIYESYMKMKAYYRDRLSPESFLLMEPYLQQATDTLSGS